MNAVTTGRRCFVCACAVLAVAVGRPVRAANDVNGTLLTFNSNGGWCWFQDPRIVIDNNQILIGSIAGTTANGASTGDVRVTSFNLSSQVSSTFTLHSALQTDDHDAATITVLPDGRYLAMYQKHSSDNLARWRISTNPGSIASWGPEQTGVANPAGDGNNNTYANPFYLSVPNKIYSFSRSVGWDPNYSVFSGLNPSNDSALSFSYGGHFLYWMNPNNGVNGANGSAGRPYVKYASNGTDKIWFVTTEDHPRNYYNSLYAGYVQFDSNGVGTVHRSDGSIIAGSNGQISTAVTPNPAPSNNNALAIPSGTGYSYSPTAFTKVFSSTSDGNTVASWANDVELDKSGNPFTVFSVRKNDPSDAYVPNDLDYYYARFDGSTWNVHRMAFAGSTLYNGENDYAGLAALDPANPNSVYISTNYTPDTDIALPHWEIYHGSTADGGATWSWTAVTSNSTVDNVRPMLADIDASRVALTWMRGTYSSYTSFNTSVVGLIVPPSGPPASLVAYWTGMASASLSDSANNWGTTTGSGVTNFSIDAAGSSAAAQPPDSNTAVVFSAASVAGSGGTLSTQLDADYSVKSLTFDVPASTAITSAAVNTNNHSLTLGTGGLTLTSTSNSSATVSGSGPVVVGTSQVWTNDSSTRSLTVAAPVRALSGATTLAFAGTGAGGIVVSGTVSDGGGTLSLTNQSGTTTLTAANTYTGPTSITAGTLVMAHPSALGTTGQVSFGSGATLHVQTDGGDTPYNLYTASGNTFTLISGVKTGHVGLNHTLGNLLIGRDATVNVVAAPNVTGGNPSITLGTISLGSGVGSGSTTFNPTTANLLLGPVSSTTNSAKTLVLGGTSPASAVTGAISNGSNVVSVTKSGSGTWTLSGSNTYTGPTTLGTTNTGSLVLTPAAWTPVLSNASGAIINGGKLVFDYAAASSPASTVVPLLKSSHDSANFTDPSQRLRTGNSNDPNHGLGYVDDPQDSRLIVTYTWYGDLNLDGVINDDDYALLDRGSAKGLDGWVNGDVNYDGVINSSDYLIIDTAFATQSGVLSPALLVQREAQFGAGYVDSLVAAVPEPGYSWIAGACAAALCTRRYRRTSHYTASALPNRVRRRRARISSQG